MSAIPRQTWIALCVCALAILGVQTTRALPQQDAGVVARWDFGTVSRGYALEIVSGSQDAIEGTVYPATGPVGTAAQFDGDTTAIRHRALQQLEPGKSVSISCWLQLEAYPWNDVPILDQADLFLGVDAEGHLLASLRDTVSSIRIVTSATLPLRQWTLVTLTRSDDQRVELYIGDRRASTTKSSAALSPVESGDLVIGHVRRAVLPAPAGAIHPNLPIEYSLEGSIGGLTVFDRALSQSAVAELFLRADKSLLGKVPWPKFPRWQGEPGSFGAFYTTLKFDPAWDRSRRVGPDSDVVVRFEHAPIQLVFWQGTSYVPAWVTENNRWYTDQFVEVYGRPRCPDGEDCEPMSDKQVRYSHVRILESTPARAVIHWRYALSEVERYGIADAPTPLAWGDWADEYWTVYPDGVAVRRQVLWSTAPEREKTEFQESIVLIPPGETPEDSIHLDALTFANLKGESRTYGWQQKSDTGLSLPKGPEGFPEPAGAVIQWVNLKSTWKPFEVAWGDKVSFGTYNGERSISSFEWWNHWPVAQIPSSGRPALAADRAGHTSLSHIYWPPIEQDSQHIGRVLMTGLTNLQADQLVPTAKAWREPARLDVTGGTEARYDAAQRAYVISGARSGTIRIVLHGSAERPILNPAFVVEDWHGRATLEVDGDLSATSRSKLGYVEQLGQTNLVVFVPIASQRDVVIQLRSTVAR